MATIEEKLQKLKEQEKKLKALKRKKDARANKQKRKLETRAKIILGGYISKHLKNEEKTFIALVNNAMNEASERDKKTLEEVYKEFLPKEEDKYQELM